MTAAGEIKPNLLKLKTSNSSNKDDSSAKSKSSIVINKKKIESSSIRPGSSIKATTSSTLMKEEVKGKQIGSTSKTVNKVTSRVKVKAEKKVYTLAGQKFDVPEEREPLRIFYETLSKQKPDSEMAEFWLMEHGMLSPDRSRKAYEKKQRRQKQQRMGTPIKSIPIGEKERFSQKPTSNPRNGEISNAKKKLSSYDYDDDDDFIVKKKARK